MNRLLPITLLLTLSACIANAQHETNAHPPTMAADTLRCDGCPEMVLVPGDTFVMGCLDSNRDGYCFDSQKPPHPVRVQDFYIGKYEVTVEEFSRFVDQTGYQTEAETEGWSNLWTGTEWQKRDSITWRDDANGKPRPDTERKHPVIHVSWHDAVAYCNWLSQETGKKYRLPTEAEWEYAARGGNKSQGYLYSGSNNLTDVAWSTENAGNYTHRVGAKKANELGIHDMSGNVWEWVEDDWHDDFDDAPTDGQAWIDDGYRPLRRVRRGGGWGNHISSGEYCRNVCRNGSPAAFRGSYVGFRLALQF